ncbi:unnamed protein product [Brachionus calyciflorus]|uniref:Uncharacterized protein n=1 Tax=Brachionus calyciflorus TaxID=104777 RepID=A0A813WG55_9BILA|nr:unnamed protein product [Brachionus calyciflorus]
MDFIMVTRANFYIRLMKNPFTKQILEESTSLNINKDLKSEILNIVEKFDDDLVTCQPDLINKLEAIKYIIKVSFETDKFGNEEYDKVKKALHCRQRSKIPEMLYGILEFNA